MEETSFEQWCIVELMGHKRLAARVTERNIAGKGFLQLDIPDGQGGFATSLYSPDSVYGLHPVEEKVARTVAAQAQSTPVHRHELQAMLRVEQLRLDIYQDDEDEDIEEDWEE